MVKPARLLYLRIKVLLEFSQAIKGEEGRMEPVRQIATDLKLVS